MAVQPIPDGYHTVTPYLVVNDVARLIDFLKQAFDAEEKHRMEGPDQSVMHAEVRIGDSPVMMGQAQGEWPPMPGVIYLYVENIDAVYEQALRAGGESLSEPRDEFYGDRKAGVKDPVGNQWWIATHIEDVAPDEMRRRQEAAMRERQGA